MGVIHLGAKLRAEEKLKLPDALVVSNGIKSKVEYLISRDIKLYMSVHPIKIVTPEEFVKKHLTEG